MSSTKYFVWNSKTGACLPNGDWKRSFPPDLELSLRAARSMADTYNTGPEDGTELEDFWFVLPCALRPVVQGRGIEKVLELLTYMESTIKRALHLSDLLQAYRPQVMIGVTGEWDYPFFARITAEPEVRGDPKSRATLAYGQGDTVGEALTKLVRGLKDVMTQKLDDTERWLKRVREEEKEET